MKSEDIEILLRLARKNGYKLVNTNESPSKEKQQAYLVDELLIHTELSKDEATKTASFVNQFAYTSDCWESIIGVKAIHIK